jgi:ElaA protein
MPSTAEASTSLPNIGVRITSEWRRFDELSAAALYELLRLRQQVFVVEQNSPYPDLDGLDQRAHHLLLADDRTLCGCLRLLAPAEDGPMARIGRVCIARHLRRRGLGHRLMAEALAFCREHHRGQVVALSAQLPLVPFYESYGFAAIGDPYDDFGVAHTEMRLVAGCDLSRQSGTVG